MSTVPGNFKYLWTAIFEDGTQLEQPADDRYSRHDDEAEGNPSAFRDVLEKSEESKLVFFYLTHTETGDRIGVDLNTGEFAINGIPFEAQDQFLDVSKKELQIVFNREVRKDVVRRVSDYGVQSTDHYINRYLIGWQVVGENITQTIALK